jgi:hypothetical protein
MEIEYCRAVTKNEMLCTKRACKNSAFCFHHQQTGKCTKFTFPIPKDNIQLPDDMVHHVYKMYFTHHVLAELKNYDPQGDFSNIDTTLDCSINLDSLTRDYRLVCDNNLWYWFRRNKLINKNKYGYTKFVFDHYLAIPFNHVFKRYYTRDGLGTLMINVHTFKVNMEILEYIANNGWFKYIMS